MIPDGINPGAGSGFAPGENLLLPNDPNPTRKTGEDWWYSITPAIDASGNEFGYYTSGYATGYAQVQAQNILCFWLGECKNAPNPQILINNGNKNSSDSDNDHFEQGREEEKSFKLFPNPTQNYVTIAFKELSAHSTIQIVDMNGKVMYQQNIDNKEMSINLTNLEKGIYMVFVLQDNNVIGREKLIIQ